MWSVIAPDDLFLKKDLLVINAHITDKPGVQTIEVSRSAHPESPSFNPELNCFILLLREDGESRVFSPGYNPGYYDADLDAPFLLPGMLFHLELHTLDGNEYHSDFDKIRPVPPIDSVYYKVEEMIYKGEEDPTPGIRFYVGFAILQMHCRPSTAFPRKALISDLTARLLTLCPTTRWSKNFCSNTA